MRGCQHRFRTLARNVSAVIHFPFGRREAHLTGGEGVIPIRYARIKFCSNPCCELVYEAIREADGKPTQVRR